MGSFLKNQASIIRLVLLLGLSSAICTAMLYVRNHYIQSGMFLWLIRPNLILAWIPLIFALGIHLLWQWRQKVNVMMLILAVPWLLFLPNAPYIVTDIVHLTYIKENVPPQLDVLMHVFTSFTGLFLGFVALYLVHEIVAASLNKLWGWLFALFVQILCGIGVYFGRFLRWNSWDFFYAPQQIIADLERVINDWVAAAFVGGFSMFLICTYAVFVSCVRLRK
ncbi:DUF1361 domain-containing protein [Brevibacillus dissolubilis]|uniref:DUF1361 domain-containing protein n=1 Tax=Brevibacillus dissolubilis TaxID=1844116 RepID=UPI0011178AF0|nr:DUF1361 domain-containing protein [Brevibacillus dissolubilis]